jgi:SAM-dependent methyltransferase
MDPLKLNKTLWENRVEPHFNSKFYDVDGFLNGDSSLKEIEEPFLQNVAGKKIFHLQCHFGMDTLSLARKDALMTGLDFSENAILRAKALAKQTSLQANFICADVHEASKLIEEPQDMVYTSYGVLGWLPDLARWAEEVAKCLKKGGTLTLVEFHPFIYTLDDNFEKFHYPYFNRKAIYWEGEQSYTDGAELEEKAYWWNHSLGEIMQSLLDVGMVLEHFSEYDYSPYACFPNMEEFEPGKHRFKSFEDTIPYVFAQVYRKS